MAHPVGLLVHDLKETVPGVPVISCRAAHGLDKSRKGGKRCTQFMAGIGEKVGPCPLRPVNRGPVFKHDKDAMLVRPGCQMGQPKFVGFPENELHAFACAGHRNTIRGREQVGLPDDH